MRILITGITGFAGGHLTEALLAQGQNSIIGLSRRGTWPSGWQHLQGQVVLRSCNLEDAAAIEALVREIRPEQIFHLAGYAHAGHSLQEPDGAWNGNLLATRRLYEAVARWGGRPRILFVGSGLIYGDAADPLQAHAEDAPLRPVNPYAASKAAADLASYQYTRSQGLDIVRCRPFNHIGPRQSPDFVVASFARQIAAIEQGLQPPVLETGNLAPRRDFTDVRDVVRAYLLLMNKGRTGEAYNIGTGEAHAIQTIVDRLLTLARVKITVRQKPELVRSTETNVVRADATRLRTETGWAPQFTLDQTLADILAYWRAALGTAGPTARLQA